MQLKLLTITVLLVHTHFTDKLNVKRIQLLDLLIMKLHLKLFAVKFSNN